MFYLVTLTLKFDLLLKNFNLGCYSVSVGASIHPKGPKRTQKEPIGTQKDPNGTPKEI